MKIIGVLAELEPQSTGRNGQNNPDKFKWYLDQTYPGFSVTLD